MVRNARRPAAHRMPAMRAPTETGRRAPCRAAETPTQRLDRLVHASTAPLTGGLSPISLALAWADWAWHLAVSPGRQMELAALGAQTCADALRDALPGDGPQAAAAPVGLADDDPRFRHPAWAQWPFSAWRAGFRQAELFWQQAAATPGMTAHHADMTRFFARQWLGACAPANHLWTNPVVLADARDSAGAHLVQGGVNWLRDLTGTPDPQRQAEMRKHRVGHEVAATPGEVVARNALVELIRYAPQTARLYPEPLLIVPSWIMKYYILDLSPHNSLVRYLVGQGHEVYMLSWRNPGPADAELTMDDYLRLGIFEPLAEIGRRQQGGRGARGRPTPVHAMGYCLGGTLLAIAAAELSRSRDPQTATPRRLPPLASLTLLAAQTDFSEPGELGLFIDESQVGYLDEITRGQGVLSGRQMAGSFQFLHSRDLVWTRRMREYLMGEREAMSDLMAWNADTTRMPARMHHEYLTSLYLHNALARGAYRVDGHAVSLADLRMPLFVVGTERDHVSPWRSVYKIHGLSDSEVTFLLASGGHNAGIVSEPGHAGRHYRMASRPAHGHSVEPDTWLAHAEPVPGSWWPAWQAWLKARSRPPRAARAPAAGRSLGPAPGRYVLERCDDER